MFFDDVRKVQIGRRSAAPASREEILATQRREKERRDLERKRHLAATLIQKIIRGFLTRHRVIHDLLSVGDGRTDARKFIIYSLVQKIRSSALGMRLEEIDPSTITEAETLKIFLMTRVRANIGLPLSQNFVPQQLPVVMELLRNAQVSWTAVPKEDLANYVRNVSDVGAEIFTQVPGISEFLPDDCLEELLKKGLVGVSAPFSVVFLNNLKDLTKFAVRKRLLTIEQFLWEHELLLDDLDVELSKEFPALALSLWPSVAGDSRALVAVLPLIRFYEMKLSEMFSGSVLEVGSAATVEVNRNKFKSRLFEVFAALLALNLRILYKRELLESRSAHLSVDRLRFWGLVANRVAAISLTENVPVSESTFALARASYDRRTVLQVPDEEWFIAGDFQDPWPRELAEFLTGEMESKNVLANFLKRLPYAISFERRVRLFHALIDEDSYRERLGRRHATIRRSELFQDGLEIFATQKDIKDNLRIAFINEVGEEEAGVDGGGLLKEFIHLWLQSAMEEERGLFVEQQNRKIIPRAFVKEPKAYAAVGRAVGKALYEHMLIDTRFSEIFMNRVFGRPFSVDELQELDEELYRNLFRLKDSQNVHTWGVSFVAAGHKGAESPLIHNGANQLVTDANKLQYIHLLARHKLVTEIEGAASQFAAGLDSIVPLAYMRFFSSSELEKLISGEDREGFDVEDLKKNCHYSGGYSESSETIEMLWHFVENEMTMQDQVALLTFVTSTPRAPLLGFRVLNPKFAIYRVPHADRLPTASTCVNLLKLPDYKDYDTLKEKLLLAIHAKSGFDFS